MILYAVAHRYVVSDPVKSRRYQLEGFKKPVLNLMQLIAIAKNTDCEIRISDGTYIYPRKRTVKLGKENFKFGEVINGGL